MVRQAPLVKNKSSVSPPLKLYFSEDQIFKVTKFQGRVIERLVKHTKLDHTIRIVWYSIIDAIIRLVLYIKNKSRTEGPHFEYLRYRGFIGQTKMIKLSQEKAIKANFDDEHSKIQQKIDDKETSSAERLVLQQQLKTHLISMNSILRKESKKADDVKRKFCEQMRKQTQSNSHEFLKTKLDQIAVNTPEMTKVPELLNQYASPDLKKVYNQHKYEDEALDAIKNVLNQNAKQKLPVADGKKIKAEVKHIINQDAVIKNLSNGPAIAEKLQNSLNPPTTNEIEVNPILIQNPLPNEKENVKDDNKIVPTNNAIELKKPEVDANTEQNFIDVKNEQQEEKESVETSTPKQGLLRKISSFFVKDSNKTTKIDSPEVIQAEIKIQVIEEHDEEIKKLQKLLPNLSKEKFDEIKEYVLSSQEKMNDILFMEKLKSLSVKGKLTHGEFYDLIAYLILPEENFKQAIENISKDKLMIEKNKLGSSLKHVTSFQESIEIDTINLKDFNEKNKNLFLKIALVEEKLK